MEESISLRLLFLPRDNRGCGFYRMFQPANWIKKLGLAEVMVNNAWDQKQVDWATTIILQRPSDWQAYDSIEEAQGNGKKIIYEIDDLLQLVNPNTLAFGYWNPTAANLGRALKLMKMCDAVTTTTPRLANEYALFNRNVFTVGNFLDPDLWNEPTSWSVQDWNEYYKKKYDNIIRIGWAGAASHRQDLELISNVITMLCKKHKNVRFVLFGFTPRDVFELIQIKEGVCPNCGMEGQLELVEGVNLLKYPDKLKSLALDIGIAPLIETGFNECKSDLKLKEYAACGIPVVASNIKPYSPSLKHGVTGFLARSGKEWYDYLETLVVNKDIRESMGKANRRWYEENTIDKHIYRWIEIYKAVTEVKYKW